MAKQVIQDGDIIFATGVRLIRDRTVNGGWIVAEFVDESFKDGLEVQDAPISDTEMEYWIDDEEEDFDWDTRHLEGIDRHPGNMGEENSAPK
jgi:hypothetical protein